MSSSSGDVLVIGAAGRYGGAAVRHLRELGIPAHAFFDERDAHRARDVRWADPGTRYARFDDPSSVQRALRGTGGLFVVLDDASVGRADRLRQGRSIGRAAAAAGIEHVVFSAATGPDHHRVACDVGDEIDLYLRSQGVPLTVLRSATVMEEIPWYWLDRFGGRLVLAMPFEATDHLDLVAIYDVGALAALAFAKPEEFAGKTLRVAGDVATPLGIAGLLAEEFAEPVEYCEVQVEGVFMQRGTFSAAPDIPWLRSVYPPLHTLRGWLEECGGRDLCGRAVRPRAAPAA